MRIVGGQFRGRALTAPKGRDTRPTTDRVRENIFNVIGHGRVAFERARVLDLFAGAGGMGFEALSRGAPFVLFVDSAAPARGALRQNAESLGALAAVKIWRRDAAKLGSCPANLAPFDLLFCDPPYGEGLGAAALTGAAAGGWLAEGAVAVLEDHVDAPAQDLPGFALLDERRYGHTQVSFWRWGAQPSDD